MSTMILLLMIVRLYSSVIVINSLIEPSSYLLMWRASYLTLYMIAS